LSNTFLFTGLSQDIYASSFSITGVLAPGTYYFTLSYGASVGGTRTVWDVNAGVGGDGPSSAEIYVPGFGTFPYDSESFTLFGTEGVPDAGSSVMLLGIGLAGVGWMRRKLRC
jgi:VPDSG-CTERM motif/PEP-CTERM motif